MSDQIVIRFARQDDLGFAYQDGYIPAEVLRQKIEAQTLNPHRIEDVVIAEWESKRVGYVRLEYLWSIVPYISLIQVLPEYRRQGVGKALLRFIETFLRDAGHEALYSSSQADEPEPQAWHRHVGFVECGFIAGINDGVDEVFFRKNLR
jgi:GNAT superfamily N-acetyltransferase